MSFEKCPFISVCIASYNYAGYLPKGFEAIKKQKFKDYEIIYLDDASTDSSVDVIQGFIKENPDMQIALAVHATNQGLLQTKTDLLKLATGKYVMLCDADDWMTDDCLDKLAQKAYESNADRVISQVFDINENGKLLQIQDFAKRPSKWLWNLHHGCLYKREIIEKNNIEILLYPDDVYMTTLFNFYSKNVAWIEEPLYYWLVHEKSTGRKKRDDIENIVSAFKDIIMFVNAIKEERQDDGQEIGLLMVKIYYLQLFHELKKCDLKEKIIAYSKLKNCMMEVYPEYLQNCYLKIRGIKPARDYAMKIMRLGKTLEKMHMLGIALMGYHFLSQWIVFDQ